MGPIEIFTTCPQSEGTPEPDYARKVADVSRWSEELGCTGMLIYTDNSIVDPWLVAQLVLQSTTRLCPLVAVQPIYMHPYAAAKMVTSLAHVHHRRIYLNMLAGGFKNDLIALDDQTPHDERYLRTTEYTTILLELLRGGEPLTFEGRYYRVKHLRLTPPLPPELFPGLMISGSSDAGFAAATALGATAMKYPRPPEEETGVPADSPVPCGVRIGLVARDTAAEAWSVAHERFPADRKGELTHQMAMKVSDSVWHKQLSARQQDTSESNPYWLVPFQHYKTNCPYLVGDYARVAAEVRGYIAKGYRLFILDIPPSREELEHASAVFARAQQGPG
jgi:alkanesulfonate monooxygenase